ncbi:MAG: PH domain-containing protein, partial [Candidatus Dormibacteraeota bacterium]|nr:PH domain-containing protein [Candidatus Dormibacteraeota bacterium]
LLGYSSYVFVLYIPAAIVLAIFLLVYRNRHALIADERGLTIQNVFSSTFIEWDLIRAPRVRPLKEHFETRERTRLIRPAYRAILPKGALFFKVRADDTTMAELRRKLSRTLLYEDTIALPLPDPDAFSWEISSHIPEPATQNLGGAKRRRGKRRR